MNNIQLLYKGLNKESKLIGLHLVIAHIMYVQY